MRKRIFVSAMLVMMVVSVLAVPSFAAETTPITYTDFEPVISAMQGQISVTTVVQILAAAIGVCIGLVFMWWGARKVTGMLMAAFKKGKIKI